jgi:predicted RNA-binding protein with PUA-like domain
MLGLAIGFSKNNFTLSFDSKRINLSSILTVFYFMKEENYSVNTNRTYWPEIYKEMLREKKAAAYYNRKEEITKINKGDTVFLYHNRVGVIAFGKAIESYRKKEFNGDQNEEYFIPLKFTWEINPDYEPEKAIKFSEIKSKLKYNSPPFFRKTVYPINEEIAKKIIKISKIK